MVFQGLHQAEIFFFNAFEFSRQLKREKKFTHAASDQVERRCFENHRSLICLVKLFLFYYVLPTSRLL